MGSSDWAAWVQAIGSLAAIAASIYFWRSDVRERRHNAAAAAGALAANLRAPAADVLHLLRSIQPNEEGLPGVGGYRHRAMSMGYFKPPKAFKQARQNVDSLGSMGPPLVGLSEKLAYLKSLELSIDYERVGVQKKKKPEKLVAEFWEIRDAAIIDANRLNAEVRRVLNTYRDAG